MNNASLHLSPRKGGGDRLREALQTIHDGDQHVFDATAPQVVHDAQPELGALGLLDPQPQNFLGAVGPDTKNDIDRLVAHGSFVAHLDPDRIEENQGVKGFERPVLPFGHLFQDRVGDGADQVGGNVDPVQIAQVTLDLAGAHPAGVH